MQLALAFMREGRGLSNNPAYAFLTFYRVLELVFPDGKKRGQWMTEHIGKITGIRAREALSTLKSAVTSDIGEHLQTSGRHAIAHARHENGDPIINPDNPRDARRLRGELPIIEELAVMAIEQGLGIQTRHTLWKEHLYELKGWKALLGNDLLEAILSGAALEGKKEADIPPINVRLRRSEPFAPLEKCSRVRFA